MEFAKGGELTQLINAKEPIPEPQIKNIFKQIYDAVQYLHNKSIIHRDLKTNNIVFLDEEKTHVAIIDFGISSTSCGGDVLKAGTLKYLPPEIFNGENFKNSITSAFFDSNFGVIKCFNLVFSFEGKLNNYGFWIFGLFIICI